MKSKTQETATVIKSQAAKFQLVLGISIVTYLGFPRIRDDKCHVTMEADVTMDLLSVTRMKQM
jgi:hypothetical protein